MQEREALIAIYNEKGEIVSSKPRKDVDKRKDILKTVLILLLDDKKRIFVTIPVEGIWPGKLASSAAGIVRENEIVQEAAERTIQRELNIKPRLIFVSEAYYDFKEIKRIISVFYCVDNNPKPDADDVAKSKWISLEDFEKEIKNNNCYPNLAAAYKQFQVFGHI